DPDAPGVVPGDQVPVHRVGAADRVVGGEQGDSVEVVALVECAGLIGADEVAADDIAAVAEDLNPLVHEAVDHQSLDGAAAGGDGQAGLEPGVDAGQLDGQERVVAVGEGVGLGAELGVAVDEHRLDDRRQGGTGLDGVDRPGGPGDVELDGVES